MPIIKFSTALDLARQGEIYSGETAVFQGGMKMGIPFSGFPSGVDVSTLVSLGTTLNERATFSGSSATTIFDVTNLVSPSYDPTHTTLRTFPYSEIDISTSGETVSAVTYSPLLLSYTANTGVNNDPTAVVWGNTLLSNLYDINQSGTTYPNNYFTQLFDNIGAGIIGNSIDLTDSEFYQTEGSNSIYSGATFNMSIHETGVHGSFPTLVTGTTSGTVTENSATTYTWSDSQYLTETSGITLPITILSADPQTTDYTWTLNSSTIIDGNIIGLQYTGYTTTYSFDSVIDASTGLTPEYHGLVNASRESFSAGTLDYKGDLTWLDVQGNADILQRTTTNELTINTLGTGSPVTMLAVDASGNVVGGSGGTVDDAGAFTSTTANNTIVPTNAFGNTNDSNYSSVLGGTGNTINTGSTHSSILGGQSNTVNHANAHILGSNITSVSADTTHVEKLNVSTLNGTTAVSSLAIDANGMVVSGNSLNTGAFTHVASGQITPTNVYSNVNISNYSSVLGGKYNTITGGTYGYNTIVGGGYVGASNQIFDTNWGFIGNGTDNKIHSSNYSNVIGGYGNIVDNASYISNIVGGSYNTIDNGSILASIVGGGYNTINLGKRAFIGGGNTNYIGLGRTVGSPPFDDSTPQFATIVGGFTNVIVSGGSQMSFIGGGFNNTMDDSIESSIVGGNLNEISGSTQAFIGGGLLNVINTGNRSSIVGGRSNVMEFLRSTIAGGYKNKMLNNTANIARNSFIGGGWLNTITSETTNDNQNFIGGGRVNQINTSYNSSIVGGGYNTVEAPYSNIGGGYNNNITTSVSTVGAGAPPSKGPVAVGSAALVIGGGYKNGIYSTSQYSAILGGFNNIVFSGSPYSTIGGGWGNRVIDSKSGFVGGGGGNKIYGTSIYSTIGGGYGNHISGTSNSNNSRYATIGGGYANRILNDSDKAFIGGGGGNVIDNSDYSSIGGGKSNTINTGSTYSSILGGQSNVNNHSNSHIIGSSITSVSANTTHVEKLNVSTLNGTTAVSSLAIDSNGMVVSGNSLNTGAFTHVATGTITPTNVYGNINTTNYSSILGGKSNVITGTSTNSVIGGGSGNTINTGATNSSIMGGTGNTVNHVNVHILGSSITSVSADTTHVEKLNVTTLNGTTAVSSLAIDANGMVVSGNSLNTGAFTHVASGQITPTNAYGNTIASDKSSILGGYNNTIQSTYSVATIIGGGNTNTVISIDGIDTSFVSGIFVGGQNVLSGSPYSVIVGGYQNISQKSRYISIVGGYQNTIADSSNNSIIGGGRDNLITSSTDSFIGGGGGGGYGNTIATANNSVIVGGQNNTNQSKFSFIGGGKDNEIQDTGTTSTNNTILGGLSNIIEANDKQYNNNGGDRNCQALQIIGGTNNIINGPTGSDTIIGGTGNKITGATIQSLIGSGYYNNIGVGTNTNAGEQNLQFQRANLIIGGGYNVIDVISQWGGTDTLGSHSIIGGYNNTIQSTTGGTNYNKQNVIAGGKNNTIQNSDFSIIGAGTGNTISGADNSSIIGGSGNTLTHNHSHIIGSNITSVSANTTHVEKLNVSTLNGTTAVSSLAIDSNGMVVSGNSLNTGAFIHVASGQITPTNLYGNSNTTNYSSILGGKSNVITGTSTNSVIGGGGTNNITTSLSSFIGGGKGNIIYENHYGTIAGGYGNHISGASEGAGAIFATIAGGYGNLITGDSGEAFVGGGLNNIISNGDYSSIVGGESNDNNGDHSIIGGGSGNTINTGSTHSSIIGGAGNTINHSNVHILGSNTTSISADTTHVQKLNIGTLNGTAIDVGLGIDVNGMVVSGNTSADNYTTGTTLVGTTLYYDRNDTLSAYTSNLSSLLDDTNFYVTGGTVISDTMYLDRTDTLSAATIDVSSLTQSGTTNYISKFNTDPTNLIISQITDDGTTVSINNASPATGFTFYVSGDTKVVGSFEADSKSFDIQHPSDPSKRLRYGSLEGPEYGVYVRGKVNGDNVINLPAYWKDLIHEDSITVQLTPFGKSQNLFVGNVNTSSIEVVGDDSPQYYYVVYGERKDIDKIIIEY